MSIPQLENETKDILRKYGIVADKRLGQNFLIDENVVNEIVEKSNVSKDDLIIEIGPGLGTLTKYLANAAGKVVCIELDRRMISILQDRFLDTDNVEILNEDILKVDLNEVIFKNASFKNVKVIANLPYYITTPIIMKLLEENLPIKSITIMIQKEVADRITALPGGKDYGVLTLSVKYYAKATTILQVPAESFLPAPSVSSTVIRLDLYEESPYKVKDPKVLFSIIKGGFAQRRKLFVNALESTLKFYKVSKEEFIEILNKYGIDELRRAETLSLEEFINISNDINYLRICRE